MVPTVRLGDVAKFVRGITFKPEDVVARDTPDAVLCFRTRNVQAELDMSDVWALPERFIKSPDRYLESGDVLVSSANSWNLVGKCCWVPELHRKGTFGGFVSVLRASDESVDPRYLFRWFSSPYIQETLRSFGQQTTNISNLNIDRCLALSLPLPSRNEQSRIVAVLEEADGLRRKRRETLAQLDALTQSIFLDMFGDPLANPLGFPELTVQEVADQVTDGEHLTPERSRAGIKLLSARNIRDGHIDFSDTDFIGAEEYARIKRRCNPTLGDVLISCSGTIGRVALVETDEAFSLVRSVALVRPRASVVRPRFVAQFLRMPGLSDLMRRRANASSQANLFQGQIRQLPLFVPPLTLQDRFMVRLEAVERLEGSLRSASALTDALFASLQYRAFNGDL